MKKFIFIILLFESLLSASFLLDKSYPLCIEDFYVKSGSLYYLRSSDDTWASTTSDKLVKEIHVGYEWDTDNEICKPKSWLILGMDVKDWHFLEALIGLLFGFVFMFFSIYLFVTVGGKR